jgi:hypothetical protein
MLFGDFGKTSLLMLNVDGGIFAEQLQHAGHTSNVSKSRTTHGEENSGGL